MEGHFPIGQLPHGLAVLADVGDHHDVVAARQGRNEARLFNVAEAFAELHQFRVGQMLVVEHENVMLEESVENRLRIV